jgi:hypothetical protein
MRAFFAAFHTPQPRRSIAAADQQSAASPVTSPIAEGYAFQSDSHRLKADGQIASRFDCKIFFARGIFMIAARLNTARQQADAISQRLKLRFRRCSRMLSD